MVICRGYPAGERNFVSPALRGVILFSEWCSEPTASETTRTDKYYTEPVKRVIVKFDSELTPMLMCSDFHSVFYYLSLWILT